MVSLNFRQQSDSSPAVLAVLERLWQTKTENIAFLESWRNETRDADISNGLGPQLIDERRHLRLLSEEIKRLGGQVSHRRTEGMIGRVFGVVREQKRDLARLCVFYRGIKLLTMSRCQQMLPALPLSVGQLLEEIDRDDNRHIRWAEIRITSRMTPADQRESSHIIAKVNAMLESTWQKSWLDLLRSGRRSA